MDVQRVRLVLGDAKGPALTEKRKTLNDYSKLDISTFFTVFVDLTIIEISEH